MQVREFVEFMKSQANPQKAIPMAAYMRSQFLFLGIPAPQRKWLTKQFMQIQGKPQRDELESMVRELWLCDEREFQYTAIDLLISYSFPWKESQIGLLEDLIVQKSWWDTVDLLASNQAGLYFQRFPDQITPMTEKWLTSSNLWLQRSALLFQLRYKGNTDSELLFRSIRRCEHSKQFFIQKAIGWALREYAKTNRPFVEQFVQSAHLAPLSRREALKARISK